MEQKKKKTNQQKEIKFFFLLDFSFLLEIKRAFSMWLCGRVACELLNAAYKELERVWNERVKINAILGKKRHGVVVSDAMNKIRKEAGTIE